MNAGDIRMDINSEINMKKMLVYILVLLLVCFFATLAMAAVAMIPRDNIQAKLEESAEYLTQHEEHFPYHVLEGVDACGLDEVADANLLNIAAYFDEKNPLETAVYARRYLAEEGMRNEGFRRVVTEEIEPNDMYFRYWHGSLLFVRPMLLIWNIQQIYVINTVVMAALFVWLMIALFRKELKTEAIALIVSMIAVNAWIVPWCLEFTWMFLVMEAGSIIALKMTMKGKGLNMLFFLTGIVTIFLDFFTTELLTLLIPLMLVIRVRERRGSHIREFAVKSSILWGMGYIGMWVMKWLIMSLISGQNALQLVKQHICLHLGVESSQTQIQSLMNTLGRNIKCLFPFAYGWIATIFSFLIITIVAIVIVKKHMIVRREERRPVQAYVLIGLIPYIRYIIIRHHSLIHYFFTYRAQAATVMALCFAIAEVVQINHKPKHTEPMPIIY